MNLISWTKCITKIENDVNNKPTSPNTHAMPNHMMIWTICISKCLCVFTDYYFFKSFFFNQKKPFWVRILKHMADKN